MLNEQAFYFEILRKYILAFGAIFSDIHVLRKDNSNVTVKDIRVPITFASKSKMSYMINSKQSQYNGRTGISTILPRMSFVISSLQRDSQRKLSSLNTTNVVSSNDSQEQLTYSGIPYNISFTLSIWVKNLSDLFQIIEQALTFFQPDYTITIKEIPSLGIQRDIPVVLGGTNFNFQTEFDEASWRELTADIEFTLKGWLYPPIKNEKIINLINVNLKNNNNIKDVVIRHDYDNLDEVINTSWFESIEANFDEKVAGTIPDDNYEETLKVYQTNIEPTLGTEKVAMWINIAEKKKKYLVYKNTDGTQTVVDLGFTRE